MGFEVYRVIADRLNEESDVDYDVFIPVVTEAVFCVVGKLVHVEGQDAPLCEDCYGE